MDWNLIFNESAKRRHLSPLREAASFIDRDDVLNMTGGVPNSSLFPFETASFTLSDGSCINFTPVEMKRALQYNMSLGLSDFLKLLTTLVIKYHNPPNMETRDLCVINGAQEGISKCFDLIVSEGDSVLVPKSVYTGVLSILEVYKLNYVTFEEDENGIIPQSLSNALYRWTKESNKPAPKVLYTIPNACNPTGTSTSGDRRKEIYKIAQEYNFVIIEDDAYFFLNFEEKFEPSFLSMDTDGRVLHVDSFSKIIAPGLRLGYVCAPRDVIYRINAFVQSTIQQVSTFTQMLMYKLLTTWNEKGFDNQIKRVRDFYKHQRDCTLISVEKWLNGLAEWNVPKGGMFVWIKILGIHDVDRLCKNALTDFNVGVLSGRIFMTNAAKNPGFIRISFATLTPQRIDEALEKLAIAIREEK
uniref:Aminotransferase class I/classII large domain-containing protein n=1 Tax=Strigamia maritima TaxID=126957 RepID=T1JA89_STRMM